MQTNPKRTKKALQELSRVFNKLATELTADLNEAIREIETLKREIRTLKSKGTAFGSNRANPTRRRSTSRSKSSPANRAHAPSHSESSTSQSTSTHQPSHHATAPAKEETPYVFPQEPYNPPAPPEPSLPGNNN